MKFKPLWNIQLIDLDYILLIDYFSIKFVFEKLFRKKFR